MINRSFSFVLPLVGVVSLLTSPLLFTSTAEAGPKCHCRNSVGERIQVGNFSCIKTHEGLKEARCEYVLNNTAWKFTGKLCPFAHDERGNSTARLKTADIDFKQLGLKHNPLR